MKKPTHNCKPGSAQGHARGMRGKGERLGERARELGLLSWVLLSLIRDSAVLVTEAV